MQNSKDSRVNIVKTINSTRVFFILLMIISLGQVKGKTINNSFPIQSDKAPQYWTDVCFYRGSSGYTQLELYYSVSLRNLQCINDSGGSQATFAYSVIVKDSDDKVVVNKSQRKIIRANSADANRDKDLGAIDMLLFDLRPGDYTMEFKIVDEVAEQESVISGNLSVPAFEESLTMSTPQFAALISSDISQKSFVKGNKMVIPNSSRKYRLNSTPLYLYLEAYNLIAPKNESNKHFQISYLISNIKGDSIIFIPRQTIAKPGSSCIKTQTIDIRGLPSGEYNLTVALSDPAAGASTSCSRNFWIYDPQESTVIPMTEKDIKKYRDQIKYFATKQELDIFDQLDPKAKETFIINFWNAKDTSPETPENEFMQDAFSRMEYANKHFSGEDSGLNSDMGRIFVIYGQPDEIEDNRMERDTKPYVVWYYYGTGQGKHSFAFVDSNGDGIYQLVHSTVENEIKNPKWMEQDLR